MSNTISKRAALFAAACLSGVLAVSGCSDGTTDSSTKAGAGQLEILLVTGARSTSIKAPIDTFKVKYPSVTVVQSEGVTGATNVLGSRIADNAPPDVFDGYAGEMMMEFVRPKGTEDDSLDKLEDLSFLYDEEGWRNVTPPQVLEQLSLKGKIYGLATDTQRFNMVYYNKQIFADSGLSPMTTYDELYTACDTLKAKGIVPIALGAGTATMMNILFWDTFLQKGGPQYYKDYFAGKKPGDDSVTRPAAEELERLLSRCVSSDAAMVTFDQAVGLVGQGKAAMTFQGDWTSAMLKAGGLVPDKDFGAFVAPGTAGSYIVLSYVLGIPKGASGRANAIEFLRMLGSRSQVTKFAFESGGLPVRRDMDVSTLDTLAKASFDTMATERLLQPDIAMGTRGYFAEVTGGFSAFYQDLDIDKLLGLLRTQYARLQ